MSQWHPIINDGGEITSTLKVPGGIIYRWEKKSRVNGQVYASSMVFVPTAPKENDKLDKAIEALEKFADAGFYFDAAQKCKQHPHGLLLVTMTNNFVQFAEDVLQEIRK